MNENVLNDLLDISASTVKLKNAIYENDIVFKATYEQEEHFFKLIMSIINNTESYVEQYKKMLHVQNTFKFIDEFKETLDEEFSFDFYKMRDTVETLYDYEREQAGGNFIASLTMLILWPLRIIVEKMYRELVGRSFDHSMDTLFNSN